MALVLDIDTFHKYVSFLAAETARAIRNEADEDYLERLKVELRTFQERCSRSEIPDELTRRFRSLHATFERRSSENVGATIVDGLITAITNFSFSYARKRKQLQVLQELKTDLEALAMHSKLQDWLP